MAILTPRTRGSAQRKEHERRKRERKKLSHTALAEKKCKEGRKDAETSNNLFHFPLFAAPKGQGERGENSRVCRGRKITPPTKGGKNNGYRQTNARTGYIIKHINFF